MIEEIREPKNFFDKNSIVLEEIVELVRAAFGRNLEYKDIYNHLTCPEKVYLLRNEKIISMASYNQRVLSGIPCLIVEGIAVKPEFQGMGVFKELTNRATNGEAIICLRTQNPRMYRALEKYCSYIYPKKEEIPEAIKAIIKDFAHYLGCEATEKGIVKEYYGGLFYGEEPYHENLSNFFKKDLEMKLEKGDALLAIGVK